MLAFLVILPCIQTFHFTVTDNPRKPSTEGLKIVGQVDYEEDWTFQDLWDILDCDTIFSSERPMPSQIEWENARELYKSIVGKDSSITENSRNGFSVPIEVKQVPSKGRGIIASRNITAGELIWTNRKTAKFKDGPSYRKFIFGLEDGLACDMQEWTYFDETGDSKVHLSVDLDEGALCNDDWEGTEKNMACATKTVNESDVACTGKYFALKNIKAGEEIICDYSSFVSYGDETFGL